MQNPALTVGLAIQPDALQGLLEKPQLGGRGLLARFLYSLPDSLVGYRVAEPPAIPGTVTAGYDRLIRSALHVQPATDHSGEPFVWLPGDDTKNRRSAELPLRTETAKELRAFLTGKHPKAAVFANMTDVTSVATALRADLKAAGVQPDNDSGVFGCG